MVKLVGAVGCYTYLVIYIYLFVLIKQRCTTLLSSVNYTCGKTHLYTLNCRKKKALNVANAVC